MAGTDIIHSSDYVQSADGNNKVDFCHATSSEKNPGVLISISEKAVNKHITRHGDILAGERIDAATVMSEQCEVIDDPIENSDGVTIQ